MTRLRGYTWQKIRKRVLDDEPLCRMCERPATEVDHIVPIHKGGGNERENLQPLCHDCHSDKTAEDKGERRRATIGLDGNPAKGWAAK